MEQKNSVRSLALIPCFNEEETVGELIQRTKRYVDSVVVVDDGSTDKTVLLAKEAGAVVLSHQKNQGKSATIKTGFSYALQQGFTDVVTIDGDGQHDPTEIPTILSELHQNGHDIVIGIRVGDDSEMPLWRKIGKRVLDYATSFGAGGYLTDSQSGFRGFNKKAVEHLLPHLNGEAFSVESEQLIKAHDLGLRLGGTRVCCKYNGLETSTQTPTTHGFSVLWSVIRMVAERRPLLFILPGLFFVFLGMFLGFYFSQTYTEPIMYGVSILLTSAFVLVGVFGVFLGLMGKRLPGHFKRDKQNVS